jgi:hypothetical protein
MEYRLENEMDRILRNEILHIEKMATALLFPQSDEATSIHAAYMRITENGRHHNHHANQAPVYIEPIEIPSFQEYVFKQLTEHGYNKNRYNQIILNNMERFDTSDQLNPLFDKLTNELESVCNISKKIAAHLLKYEYESAKSELTFLKNSYPKFFPKTPKAINIFEAKPGFFGFSVNLFALYSWVKSRKYFRSKSKT